MSFLFRISYDLPIISHSLVSSCVFSLSLVPDIFISILEANLNWRRWLSLLRTSYSGVNQFGTVFLANLYTSVQSYSTCIPRCFGCSPEPPAPPMVGCAHIDQCGDVHAELEASCGGVN